MARKPEIFLRELDPDEAQRLVKIARTTRDRVRMRRAGMALASMQGRSVPEIATMFAAKEETVRELIRALDNYRGFAALDPKVRRGSMPRIGPKRTSADLPHGQVRPGPAGLPVHLLEPDQAARLPRRGRSTSGVSHETIRLVLRTAGISFQNTKTWKHSNDPQLV